MRWTVCGEMASTTPSRINCRASSTLSHCAKDRPTTSGRSQANLTTYNATAGGKNRPPAGAFLVTQPIETMGDKAQGPLADMPLAQRDLPGHGGKGVAVGQEQHGTRPFGEPDRGLLFPEPPRQGGPGGVRHLNMNGRVASLHIFTPSGCQASVMKHQPPHCQFFRPFSMGTCTKATMARVGSYATCVP